MWKLFDIVPSWVYALAIVALAALYGITRINLSLANDAHSVTKATFADYQTTVFAREAARAAKALEETEKRRENEMLRIRAASAADAVLHAERAHVDSARVAGLHRERVLRDTIGLITAPSTPDRAGNIDPAALTRAEQAATAFGHLLEACRREGREDAEELEDLASRVRGLQTVYQSILPPP